jgi:aconitate hydratase
MTVTVGHDSTKTRKTLTAGGQTVAYYSIPAAEAAGLGEFTRLPAALKVVLENMLRFEDGKTVTVEDIRAFAEWGANGGRNPREIAYRPARVLMQDFTGVPAVVDLAAMRDGILGLGGDAQQIDRVAAVQAGACVQAAGQQDFVYQLVQFLQAAADFVRLRAAVVAHERQAHADAGQR